MKKEIREETIIRPRNIYIANDGTEFYKEDDCRAYELSIMKEKPKVLATAIKNVKSFYEELPAIIYHVESIDDWEILKNYVWGRNISWEKYIGPGDYIAIEDDQGDYDPSYNVYEINSYCSDILADANYYKKHIIEIIEQNT